jgi:hypothetical protein
MICLVDRIPVEVKWQTPLVRFRAFIPQPAGLRHAIGHGLVLGLGTRARDDVLML